MIVRYPPEKVGQSIHLLDTVYVGEKKDGEIAWMIDSLREDARSFSRLLLCFNHVSFCHSEGQG